MLYPCLAAGGKTLSLAVVYGAVAALSLVLLVVCCLAVRQKRAWFILLFSCVAVVNCGYTFLSLSTCLEAALWANRVAYLGSVFLPLSMLMILLGVTNTRYAPWLPRLLLAVAVPVFLLAASPGVLDWYYRGVSFAVVDGVATLVKQYGPLHGLYLVYLLGYFAAMVFVILRAQIKKTVDTAAHAVVLAIAVAVNIGVWAIEQMADLRFEMLSVSYIISELFLLGVHLVMKENRRLREQVRQVETAQEYPQGAATPEDMLDMPLEHGAVPPERIELFMRGLSQLTPTERAIYEAYISRLTTKEVLAALGIKESTLKYHNRNLYSKLGVSSRSELLELHKHLRSVSATLGER